MFEDELDYQRSNGNTEPEWCVGEFTEEELKESVSRYVMESMGFPILNESKEEVV